MSLNSPKHFLWPTPKPLLGIDWIGKDVSSDQIESQLRNLYQDAFPVLFSSARAGLSAILMLMKLGRTQFAWTPGFSSHCVLEAVAHVCTPTPVVTSDLSAALIYHQWGFVHDATFSDSVCLIEDAVDSLILPGSSPFTGPGSYTLWSLPKVLATTGGGVVFCRHENDAIALRECRNLRPKSLLQAVLRIYSKSNSRASSYWNGAEAMQGQLISPLRRQISRELSAIDNLIESRLSLLNTISPMLATKLQNSGRLPSNLPLRPPKNFARIWSATEKVTSGLRYFNVARRYPESNWTRVAPLPVHHDIHHVDLLKILKPLNLKDCFNELEIL